jgi:hypothetical protein
MNDYIHIIHIGKCAGGSVRKELKKHNIKYKETHIDKHNFDPNEQYIILLRNPIQRIISAFNFRKYVIEDKGWIKGKYDAPNWMNELEKSMLFRYKSINQLAEDIYDDNNNLKLDLRNWDNYLRHVRENIHWHLIEQGNFLKKMNINNIKGVIVTETYNEDMKNIFNIDSTIHSKKIKNKYDRHLSKKGYKNLKTWLKKDYECINILYNKNLISKKQFELLSK